MSVQIIVDSTVDMPERIKKHFRIVPLTVHFRTEEFIDGVTIDKKRFYERLVESDVLPTTSQATPAAFQKEFEEVDADGDSAVVITISSKLSGTYQSACIAAADFDNIFVVDSMSAAIGSGILAKYALRRAEEGLSAKQLADEITKKRDDVCLVALLDTLEYLKKGGRIGLAAVCALIAVVIVDRQQLHQRRRLGLGQFSFHFFQPVNQGGDFLFCLPEHGVGFPNPVVEIALVGADALGLHCSDSRPLMLSGHLLHTPTLIAAVVAAAIQTLLGKLGVAKFSPCLSPYFQRFRATPIGGGYGVEHIVASLVPDAVAVLIQHIFPPLFVAPSAVRLDRADGTHDMKMRVLDAAALLIR